MHHRMTEGLRSAMRSTKCSQDVRAYKELLKIRGQQTCPQNKLLQKLRPYRSEGYRELLGDTYQRNDAHIRQWRFVTYAGIPFFFEQCREED